MNPRLRIGDVLMCGTMRVVVYAKRWHPIGRFIEATCIPSQSWTMKDTCITFRANGPAAGSVIGHDLALAARAWGWRAKDAIGHARAARNERSGRLWREFAAKRVRRGELIRRVLKARAAA